MRKAAKDVAANEKEIYVIVLKVFLKLKFTLMKHLEQNEKVFTTHLYSNAFIQQGIKTLMNK